MEAYFCKDSLSLRNIPNTNLIEFVVDSPTETYVSIPGDALYISYKGVSIHIAKEGDKGYVDYPCGAAVLSRLEALLDNESCCISNVVKSGCPKVFRVFYDNGPISAMFADIDSVM